MNMAYTISVTDTNQPDTSITFPVEADQTILEAGLARGINLPYGCQKGFCGNCRAKIQSGSVDYAQQPAKLSDDDIAEGWAFLCSAHPVSDVHVAVALVNQESDIEKRILPCKVNSMRKLADDVMLLQLKLGEDQSLLFLPGQYIDILLENGKRRSFSIANDAQNLSTIDLHIRHVPGGLFTDHVFTDMREKELLRIEGPLGGFYFHEQQQRPLIFMAGGTGFAPIKAIIEHLIAKGVKLPLYFYWGARARADLYLHELAEEWTRQHPHIHYIPVLSDPLPTDQWQGRSGYVHEAVCQDFADLSAYDIYTCGPPVMIQAAEKAFAAQGMDKAHFYYDAFDLAAANEA